MRRVKISSKIFISIGVIIIIFIGVIMYALGKDDSFSSPFNKLSKEDYQNFQDIGNQIFHLSDEGYLAVGESIGTSDYANKPKVEKILANYKGDISSVHLVDKDVILISFGAVFQSIDGIAIRRNNTELKNTYKDTGFDEGILDYTELIPNVFHFTAGL